MGNYRSGHNGTVLKTGEYFGSRISIFPVFSTGRGCKKLRENRDFSPSFSPFFRETLEREYIWRCTQAVEGTGLENGRAFWKPFFNFLCVFNGLRRQEIKRKSGFLSKFLSFFRETLEREYIWRCTQAVEGNGLENREVGVENRRGGSNPSISASQSKVRFALIFYLPHQEITFKAPPQAVCQNIAKAHFRLLTDCVFDDLEKQEPVVSFAR